MITPEKTYSTNPFVDNIIYYAKLMALNCTIKDEEEALSYETKESIRAADLLIACVEGKNSYDMFDFIPKEIISKYIDSISNLELYLNNTKTLRAYLNTLSKRNKTKVLNNLSSLARTIYIDHYEIMDDYLAGLPVTWLDDHLELYNKCVSGEATFVDLFDELPVKTNLRIIKRYLNAYDFMRFSELWDNSETLKIEEILAIIKKNGEKPLKYSELKAIPQDQNTKAILLNTNYILEDLDYETSNVVEDYTDALSQFIKYITSRDDPNLVNEVNKINQAMRDVFKDHYEMMLERKYFSLNVNDDPDISDDEPAWMEYYPDKETYDKCKLGTATYYDMFTFFPENKLKECLIQILGEEDVNEFNLASDADVLKEYFNSEYCTNAEEKEAALNSLMTEIYLNNYQLFMNTDIYYKCQDGSIDLFGLMEYIPKETMKSIILTEMDEVTNIDIYSKNKDMLDEYLNSLTEPTIVTYTNGRSSTLPKGEAIKYWINQDMSSWYPENHVEKNNYYRALIGLPPLDAYGNPCVDTLIHSYDEITLSYNEFGNRFIDECPKNIYPEYHWRQELYKYNSYDVAVLEEAGIITDYLAACGQDTNNIRYRYINYLGDYKLNLYECRKAMNFQLIGMPTVDDATIKRKFTDTYELNRDYVVRAVYSDAYKFQSNYFNKFIIIFILINTIMDMLSGIPDFIINKDVFDARCIKYLFESYGIPYYAEIPIKYQQAMLKNLNTLIKYKSSTKNMVDICSLFGFRDVRVFGYYLMKDRNTDVFTGDYVFDEHNQVDYDDDVLYVIDKEFGTLTDVSGRKFSKLKEYRNYDESYYYKTISVKDSDGNITKKKIIDNDKNIFVYDARYNEMIPIKDTTYFYKIQAEQDPASLKFIKVPVDENLTKYKNDSDYIIDYDEITTGDDIWDGGLDHEYLKRKILDYEFNAVKSKYISIETTTDLSELAFQMSYFYNMLFDGYYSEDSLNLDIPYLRSGHKFRFMDVICYMFALNFYYYGLKDNIMYSPTQILYVKGYNFNDDLNKILQDPKIFTQVPPIENIFDINERIKEDGYDYQKEFDQPHLKVKQFNLQANIDEINLWLNETYQIDLDDFIIEYNDDGTPSLTVKDFFSLNNTEYQKSIFSGDMIPIQYNNDIKYGYDYDLLEKININDINTNSHVYVQESDNGNEYYYLEVIEDDSEDVFIFNHNIYAIIPLEGNNAENVARGIYNKYSRRYDAEWYDRASKQYYHKIGNEYIPLVNGKIRVKNSDGYYVFGTDKIYIMDNETGTYTEVTDPKYFTTEPNDMIDILNFNIEYFILTENGYELNTDLAYIKIVDHLGNEMYVPLSDIDQYEDLIIQDSGCYIRHSDGHFIRFDTTDYYKRNYGKNILMLERDLDRVYVDNLVYKFNPRSGIINISGSSTIAGNSANKYYTIEDDVKVYYNARFMFPEDTEVTFCANASMYIDGITYAITDGTEMYVDDGNGITFTANANTLYSFIIINSNNINIPEETKISVRPQVELGSEVTDFEPYRYPDKEYGLETQYLEEPLYVKTNEVTEYFDPEEPDVYYKKLDQYYEENSYDIYRDEMYVLDSDGNYISVNDMLSPLNCYFYDQDKESYELIIDNFFEFKEYENPRDVRYVLIKQPNMDYYKYAFNDIKISYERIHSDTKRYIYNSNNEYITVIYKDKTYSNTNILFVELNANINSENVDEFLGEYKEYNPSLNDDIWDENDWYYEKQSSDPDISIGMNGENLWYYIKPGSQHNPNDTTENQDSENESLQDIIGSGYYLESSSYVGQVEFIESEEYYISFDVETNFNGSMNIYCSADSGMHNSSDRLYTFRNGEKQHISQVFIANEDKTPRLNFLKYNFTDNPIVPGNYVVVSNIRVIKSYSDNFITTDIPSYDQLDKLYRTNEKIYKWLVDAMAATDDKHLYDIYKKLYDALMISNYNKEAFKIGPDEYAKTYTEFLNTRDEVLYDRLQYFSNMEFEVMQKAIADEIIELTYALNDVIGEYGYDYLYAHFPGTAIPFIQDYIYKIINWFKSWKVQLLGINTVYYMGGGSNNSNGGTSFDNTDYLIKILQKNERKIKIGANLPEGFVYGCCKVNPIDGYSPDGTLYAQKYDFDPVYQFDKSVGIKHRLRIITRTANSLTYTDNQTNLRLSLYDDSTHVWVDDKNILKIRTINGDSFEPINGSELLMHVNEEENFDMYISQVLGEVNLLSGDYIEYDEMED